jgi:hypothetical protein
MREQDIRRILKDVCEALDRQRAKAAPIAVGVALAMGAGCGGEAIIVQVDATASETSQTSSEASTQDSATSTDSTSLIETEPMVFYGLATVDSTVPSTDSDSASDVDAEAETRYIPICMYMCSMAMDPTDNQDPNAPKP